jgi:hypothetical protein
MDHVRRRRRRGHVDCSEPSLDAVLRDPIIQAMMVADCVDPAAFSALIEGAARQLTPDMTGQGDAAGAVSRLQPSVLSRESRRDPIFDLRLVGNFLQSIETGQASVDFRIKELAVAIRTVATNATDGHRRKPRCSKM